MQNTTITRHPPVQGAAAEAEELLSRIERLQRRIATLSETRGAADAAVRRQRAAGRKP